MVFLTAFINLLLPVERGFPLVPVGPVNIVLPVFLNLLAFGALFVARPIRTLRGFRHPPLFWQGLVSLFLLVRALFSPEFGKAVATAVIYTGTWVAQFALLLTVLTWVGRPAFARVYLAVAGVSATLGILEGLFGIVLPPYQLFRLLESIAHGYGEAGSVGRVDGPPGNSILFAFMLALSIPFAFEIRTRPIRWGLIALFVVAVVLTIARIGYLMLIIIALGGLLMGGKRANAAAIGLGIVAVATILVATVFSDNPTVGRIGDRLTGRGEASENVRFRAEAIRLSVGRTVDDGRVDVGMWGAGVRAGDRIGARLSAGTGGATTIDNTYATLFYEGGVMLLVLYLGAHSYHLRRLWAGYGPARLYWFGMIAALVGGVAFVAPYSAVVNFPFVATLAVLGHERMVRQKARRRLRVAARPAPAPVPAATA